MGIIDAFCLRSQPPPPKLDIPANFGDCMEGRIRFMTAIYIRNFACPLPKPGLGIFPTDEPERVKTAMNSKGGPTTLMEELAPRVALPLARPM